MARVRAGAVAERNGQLLLMFRRRQGQEYWCLPGGGVEPGESPEAAAVREVAEETSVTVAVERPAYRLEKPNGDVELYFRCRYVSGEPSVSAGSPEAARMRVGNYYRPQWVPVVDLPQLLIYPLEVRDWLIAELRR